MRLVNHSAILRSPIISPRDRANAGWRPNLTRVVKLSVIVPFYNVQTYAPDTLRSLQANARDDFEFLLVDDCSTDGTPEILERAEREVPGARLIRHEQNGGLATARNRSASCRELARTTSAPCRSSRPSASFSYTTPT